MNLEEQIVADYNNPKLDVVQIDGLVVMKIIKQCKEYLPELVPGQLLGLDIGTSLEVSNCFPFPNPRDQDDDSNDGIAEYQLEMMRFLREVNIDSNTVGWYTPTYLNSFFNESVIETQFNYQATINQKCVVIVYDPIKTSQGTLSLRCFRLTSSFMDLFKDQVFSRDRLDSANLNFSDIFEQIPIKIHNSQLINALLYELDGADHMTTNFDRLNIGNNIYLEKVVEGMTDCVESLSQELGKVVSYQRNFQQQQFQRNSFIQKKALEGQKVEEDEIQQHLATLLNKPLHAPSKLTMTILLATVALVDGGLRCTSFNVQDSIYKGEAGLCYLTSQIHYILDGGTVVANFTCYEATSQLLQVSFKNDTMVMNEYRIGFTSDTVTCDYFDQNNQSYHGLLQGGFVCQDPPATLTAQWSGGVYFENRRSSARLIGYVTLVELTGPLDLLCTSTNYICTAEQDITRSSKSWISHYRLTFVPKMVISVSLETIDVVLRAKYTPSITVQHTFQSIYDDYDHLQYDLILASTNLQYRYGQALIVSPTARTNPSVTISDNVMVMMVPFPPNSTSAIPSATFIPIGSDPTQSRLQYNLPYQITGTRKYNLIFIKKTGIVAETNFGISVELLPNTTPIFIRNMALTYPVATTTSFSTLVGVRRNLFSLVLMDRSYPYTFPYGYGPGTLDQYNYTTSIPFSNFQGLLSGKLTHQGGSNLVSQYLVYQSNPLYKDDQDPQLVSLSINAIDAYSFIYTVTALDKSSGVYSIVIYEDNDPLGERTVVLKQTELVSGNAQFGTYNITVNKESLKGVHHSHFGLFVNITDRVGRTSTCKYGSYIPYTNIPFPYFPIEASWDSFSITGVSFQSSLVDTSTGSEYYQNVMKLKIYDPQPRYTPKVRFNFHPNMDVNNQHFVRYGLWDQEGGIYQIAFKIPANITNGEVSYDIFGDEVIPSSMIQYRLGPVNAVPLVVTSKQLSLDPPTIGAALAQQSYVIDQGASVVTKVTLSIRLQSSRSPGFLRKYLSGYFVFQGDYDPIPRNVSIDSSKLLESPFSIPIQFNFTSPCRSQTYRSTYVYLTDSLSIAKTKTLGYYDPEANFGQMSFNISCATLYHHWIVNVFVQISHPSGYPRENAPTIYVQSLMGDIISFKTYLASEQPPTGIPVYYEAQLTIPYGWGSSDLFLSIYGIVDYFGNFNGFSTDDLIAARFTGVIERQFGD
eukprot:gene14226-16785_t